MLRPHAKSLAIGVAAVLVEGVAKPGGAVAA
jgi:hypothetical protein